MLSLDETHDTAVGRGAAGRFGDRPALRLAHPWPSASGDWHRVIPALSAHDRVDVDDMPGNGGSEMRPGAGQSGAPGADRNTGPDEAKGAGRGAPLGAARGTAPSANPDAGPSAGQGTRSGAGRSAPGIDPSADKRARPGADQAPRLGADQDTGPGASPGADNPPIPRPQGDALALIFVGPLNRPDHPGTRLAAPGSGAEGRRAARALAAEAA